MRVIISYRSIPQSPGWSTGDMLARAFESLGHEVFRYARKYQSEEWLEDPDKLLRQKYDIHVFCEKNDGEDQYLELKDIARFNVCWFFDIAMNPQFYRDLANYFNFNAQFIANPDFLQDFYCGIFLPYAADEKLHYRPLSFAKKYDFILAGSDRPERRKLISDLNSAGINAHLITYVYREAYIDALASAKVVINDEAGGGQNLLAMRWAEAQMAGSRILTPSGPLENNLRAGLQNSKMSCDYNSIEEIVIYGKNWLDKVPSQEDHNNFIKNHSYQNRVQKILEVCGFV